ncbi:NAD(P)-dependent oxidoreductase [Parvularcula lutaonensis]|uniref:NAD(P)-dependent oxidoreductase n=1 Tax=Parvularcula lutaonensis TaxID=491923 RepID=A0ABV7M8P3_9PROT|nr:NAD(P)-dependent oxidoreductase [Parvularcula lutaonensis]
MTATITVRVHEAQEENLVRSLEALDAPLKVVRGPTEGAEGPRVLIAFRPPGDEDVTGYDWIHLAGAGADHMAPALKGARRLPIVTKTVGAMGRQMAEYCLSYVLADLQLHAKRATMQRDHRWSQSEGEPHFLFDRSVAIIGTGAIGSAMATAIAPLAKEVIGYSRSGKPAGGFTRTSPLEAFEAADIAIAALPLAPGTKGVIGENVLGRMQSGLFINVGRGATVDEIALRSALARGAVRKAVLDVFAEEPLPEDHWAWEHPDVVVTSHVSGVTREEDTLAAFRDKLPGFLDGTLRSDIDIERGY